MAVITIRTSASIRERSSAIFVILTATLLIFGCTPAEPRVEDSAHPVLAAEVPTPTVNINSASVEELEKVPHIGRKLAERIVAHRETYGRFARPEELLLVRGLSEKSFREIRPLLIAE